MDKFYTVFYKHVCNDAWFRTYYELMKVLLTVDSVKQIKSRVVSHLLSLLGADCPVMASPVACGKIHQIKADLNSIVMHTNYRKYRQSLITRATDLCCRQSLIITVIN